MTPCIETSPIQVWHPDCRQAGQYVTRISLLRPVPGMGGLKKFVQCEMRDPEAPKTALLTYGWALEVLEIDGVFLLVLNAKLHEPSVKRLFSRFGFVQGARSWLFMEPATGEVFGVGDSKQLAVQRGARELRRVLLQDGVLGIEARCHAWHSPFLNGYTGYQRFAWTIDAPIDILQEVDDG